MKYACKDKAVSNFGREKKIKVEEFPPYMTEI